MAGRSVLTDSRRNDPEPILPLDLGGFDRLQVLRGSGRYADHGFRQLASAMRGPKCVPLPTFTEEERQEEDEYTDCDRNDGGNGPGQCSQSCWNPSREAWQDEGWHGGLPSRPGSDLGWRCS
jgi:hypothetical protein